MKIKYKLKERDMNKGGEIDRGQPDRYEAVGMEEELLEIDDDCMEERKIVVIV